MGEDLNKVGPKDIEIYIVVKKDNTILTRNKSDCMCLGQR